MKAVSDDALRYEILDTDTGHSIATRTVNETIVFNLTVIKFRSKARLPLNDAILLLRERRVAQVMPVILMH